MARTRDTSFDAMDGSPKTRMFAEIRSYLSTIEYLLQIWLRKERPQQSCHDMPPILTVEHVVVGVEGNRIGFCCQLTDESVTLVLLSK